MIGLVPAEKLVDYVGQEIGSSDWFEVDQDRIDMFADATLDHQFIHVDTEKATPLFGSTIAHGFLSLSLVPHLTSQAVLAPENLKMVFNYGLDKVRFLIIYRYTLTMCPYFCPYINRVNESNFI